MAFVVTCPSCKARLKTMVMAPAGTLSECPGCLTQFTLTEDTPELLEKKTPPLKSATSANIKGDQTAGADRAGTGTPIKAKLKKNRVEDESEGVQPRSQKEQVTDDAVEDRDVPKRRTRRDDADEMEERAPPARSKPRKKKNNPLFLVLAISLPLLLIIGGGVGYGIYSYFHGDAKSEAMLSANIPPKHDEPAENPPVQKATSKTKLETPPKKTEPDVNDQPEKAFPTADELTPLITRLREGKSRAETAGAITKLGKKALPALPELVRLLDDADPEVRVKASEAIFAIGRQPTCAVLDFYADWCGPCRSMKPLVEKLVGEGAPIIKVDIDKYPELTNQFKVESIPTCVAVKNDTPVGRQTGTPTEELLRTFIARVGKPDDPVFAGLDNPASEAAALALVLGLDHEEAFPRFVSESILRSHPKSTVILAALLDAKYPLRLRLGAIRGFLIHGKELPADVRKTLAERLAGEKEPIELRGYAAIALGTGKDSPATIPAVLIKSLQESQVPDLRRRAANRLGELRTVPAVPALTKALKDDKEEVRLASAVALGRLSPHSLPAVPGLLQANVKDNNRLYREALDQISQSAEIGAMLAKALSDEEEAVRLLAVELLGGSSEPEAAGKELIKALGDASRGVRVRSAALLSQLGGHDTDILPVLLDSLVSAEEFGDALGALANLGPRALPELVKVACSPDKTPEARLRAVNAMRNGDRLPAPIIEALKSALKANVKHVRTCSALALVRITPKDEAVTAALIAGLDDQHAETRAECIRALVETKPATAVGPLFLIVRGDDEDARREAAYALSQFELNEEAVNQAVGLLAGAKTRASGTIILGSAGKNSPNAVAALLKEYVARKDDRDKLGRALTSNGRQAVPGLLKLAEDAKQDEWFRVGVLEVLGAMNRQGALAGPALTKLMKSPNKPVALQAAVAAARVGEDPAAVPLLLEALTAFDGDFFDDAIGALNALGPKAGAGADPLAEMLKKADDQRKSTLAHALVAITHGTDKAVPPLMVFLLADVEAGKRETVLSVLQTVGKPAIPHLVRALTDNRYHRPSVIKVLGFLGEDAKAAVPVLVRLLADDDRTLAAQSAETLAMIDPKQTAAVPVLAEMFRSPDAEKRRTSISLLARFGKDARPAVPELILALKEPFLRSSAAHALAAVGPDAAEAVEPLIRLLPTRDGQAAAHALAAIGPKAIAAVPPLLKLLDREKSMLWVSHELVRFGKPAHEAIPVMAKKLNGKNPSRDVLRSLAALAPLDQEMVLTELLKRTGAPETESRVAVMEALGSLKSPKIVAVLVKALDDPESDVRCSAASSLGRLGEEAVSAVPILIEKLKGNDQPLRQAAAMSLGDLGPKAEAAIPELIRALDDKSIRATAANSLGEFGPKAISAVPKLIKMLDDTDSRYPAVRALAGIGPAAKEALPRLKMLLASASAEAEENDGGQGLKEAIDQIEEKKKSDPK